MDVGWRGGNILAPYLILIEVWIPTIVERRCRQIKKKFSCNHQGFLFLAKKRKIGDKKKVRLQTMA
jgi:hypothetical protein